MFRRKLDSVFGGDTRGSSGQPLPPHMTGAPPVQQQPQPTQAPGEGGGTPGNETYADDFARVTAGMWDDPKVTNAPGQTAAPANPSPTAAPAGGTFEQHIEGLQFHKIPPFNAAEQAQLQAGDFKPMMDRIQQMSKGIYQQAMADSFKMLQNRGPQLVEDAVSRANNTRHAEHYVNQMQDKLPFTKDPAIETVAKSAFKRFLTRGDDVETAIENTRIFFTGMSDRAAAAGGNDGRGGGQQAQKVENWFEFMTGGSQ